MDEEQTNEKEATEGTEENTGERSKSETDIKVEHLNADTERINQAIAENENARARQKLGGLAEAGSVKEKPKEESNKEYVDKLRKNGWRADG
ncbi:MAG: hypothetical protein GWP19_00960 [Planctomycetia bacterium]|nr:hypothetical protein [Planctomycetia bacterium]